jgi:hypothetical protein
MLAPLSEAMSMLLFKQHQLGVVFCLSLFLVVTLFIRRLRRWQRLRHIPGPPLAGFSRLAWLVPLARSGEIPTWMREAEQKYGKTLTQHQVALCSCL